MVGHHRRRRSSVCAYAYAWCLGICVTHRWLCRCCCCMCCCSWPVLLVCFYYSIILIVQRMRYLCMYTNIIDCVEKWCAWKDKNFKANGIFNFWIRISIRCAQDVPNDNDRNTQHTKKFTTRLRESCMCNNGVVKFIGNWTIWRCSSRYYSCRKINWKICWLCSKW